MKFNNKIANKAIKNILLDQILKANEKLTFIAMVECFDFSKGYSEISISEIGEAITIKNRNTICNIVKKLETLGYIKVIHQNGKTNVYQITKYLNFKYDDEERNIKMEKSDLSDNTEFNDINNKESSNIEKSNLLNNIDINKEHIITTSNGINTSKIMPTSLEEMSIKAITIIKLFKAIYLELRNCLWFIVFKDPNIVAFILNYVYFIILFILSYKE